MRMKQKYCSLISDAIVIVDISTLMHTKPQWTEKFKDILYLVYSMATVQALSLLVSYWQVSGDIATQDNADRFMIFTHCTTS